mgnify:CR=1 FL=1
MTTKGRFRNPRVRILAGREPAHARQGGHRRHCRTGGAAGDPGQCPEPRHQDRTRQPAHRSARRLRRGRWLRSRAGARHSVQRTAERRRVPIQVQIISKDSQSSGSRAAEVASELILGDKVDLIVASATPDTTNPVADQAEVNEVPCITTNCPWQPYFFGRKGDPAKGFTWTYHFFWGLEDVIGAFLALWDSAPDQQGRGRALPQRCRRQRLGRSAARPAAGAGAGRLQAHRSRPLSSS